MAQVPHVSFGPDKCPLMGEAGGWGWECRSLFTAREGWVLVGGDAAGLELRCFAHYLARYDGGAYGMIVCDGDVHTANMLAAGLATRDLAKTFIYAYLYGAGDELIGAIVGGGEREGKRLKREFAAKTPGLLKLKQKLAESFTATKTVRGIDGRVLNLRHKHAALNTLLQGAGAVAMKLATVLLHRKLKEAGLVNGKDYAQVAHVHDEIQLEVRPAHAQFVGEQIVAAIREAGVRLGFRCPLDGAFKVGRTWAETH